ncbi:MAG: hypothetical protein Q9187_004764 [Circinaria calcarea]
MKHSSDLIRSFCRSSINSKRQKPKIELEGELDILTVAMDSGAFSDEDLVDQMMTFLAAADCDGRLALGGLGTTR